uniref:F-box domain-containing protein n=1 Tax=Davidia involucrata TaxID=16924 RepID=A0A5B6YRJ9_DAVIN
MESSSMECSSSDPCSDIIFEILSPTSLKTVDRCKLVCKKWNQLTYESSFMHSLPENKYYIWLLHSTEKTLQVSIQFVSINESASTSNLLSLDFLPNDVWFEAYSNQGLLCCVSWKDSYYRYYDGEKVTMVVLRSNLLHYKIIRLLQPNH